MTHPDCNPLSFNHEAPFSHHHFPINPATTPPLIQPRTTPLLCLEYLYEANIDRGDLVYILRDDALLQDRFYALASSRANIMVASWDDRRHQPDSHGSFRHGFNRETHYVMVFRGIAELEGELGFLKNHSRFDSRSWFLVVFLDVGEGVWGAKWGGGGRF
ncbi:hypothetical protein pipiens_007108 [Culex pipiens pipiens]|uniref:Uncharacterized protein n=1 Tax=Culex pipiens pipiens TaxID=38569 RepID=A0ABD1DM63_CULPP